MTTSRFSLRLGESLAFGGSRIGAQLVAVLVRDIESAPGSAKAYFVTDICFQHAAWEQNLVAALTWFTSPGGPSNDR